MPSELLTKLEQRRKEDIEKRMKGGRGNLGTEKKGFQMLANQIAEQRRKADAAKARK